MANKKKTEKKEDDKKKTFFVPSKSAEMTDEEIQKAKTNLKGKK